MAKTPKAELSVTAARAVAFRLVRHHLGPGAEDGPRTKNQGPGRHLSSAVVGGLIVFGPPRGAEATFVRVDKWLPKQEPVPVADARADLDRAGRRVGTQAQ